MCANEKAIELQIAFLASGLADAGVISREEATGAMPEGNANSFVPWDDPQIPFECYCGEIIYADTPHEH